MGPIVSLGRVVKRKISFQASWRQHVSQWPGSVVDRGMRRGHEWCDRVGERPSARARDRARDGAGNADLRARQLIAGPLSIQEVCDAHARPGGHVLGHRLIHQMVVHRALGAFGEEPGVRDRAPHRFEHLLQEDGLELPRGFGNSRILRAALRRSVRDIQGPRPRALPDRAHWISISAASAPAP